MKGSCNEIDENKGQIGPDGSFDKLCTNMDVLLPAPSKSTI